MAVEVRQVSKKYGEQFALDHVTFTVGRGEVVGLLGPNGAGKSTLMKIIACFIPPSGGEVIVNGHNVMTEPVQVRQILGYLPENNPLYTEMYVREYLSFMAGIFHLGKRTGGRIAEIIEMAGLQDEQHKKIRALSKGYRQRVGLAQALIHDPEVLIMDEPTSGLDPNQIIGIRDLIRGIGKEKTVILSTHILQEVESMCTRAIILDHGRIVADDEPKKLSSLIPDTMIIMAEFSSPVALTDLEKIPGALEAIHVSGNTYQIRSKGIDDIRPQVFQFAVRSGITVLSLSRKEQSLENVFQELTKK